MAIIYKIENKITHNIYIGQTVQTLAQRWGGHVYAALTDGHKDYTCPLHNAIRKYGKDAFDKIIIEECPIEKLNEREIYWIQYYNSYNNGYNAALGGDGHQKYDYNEIVDYYLSHGNAFIDTCLHFGIYDQVLYTALRARGIDYKNLKNTTPRKKHKKPILLVEKKLVFNKMVDIDKYLNKTNTHGHIRHCLDGLIKSAYGYHWKEIEDDGNLADLGYTLWTPTPVSV